MDKRTVSSAHQRIDEMQLQIVELRTEAKVNFRDLFNRVCLLYTSPSPRD